MVHGCSLVVLVFSNADLGSIYADNDALKFTFRGIIINACTLWFAGPLERAYTFIYIIIICDIIYIYMYVIYI